MALNQPNSDPIAKLKRRVAQLKKKVDVLERTNAVLTDDNRRLKATLKEMRGEL